MGLSRAGKYTLNNKHHQYIYIYIYICVAVAMSLRLSIHILTKQEKETFQSSLSLLIK